MSPLEIEQEKRRVVIEDEFRKLMRAYAGFQMATALFVASKATDVCGASLIVTLFAISVPSTIAYGGLARITKEDEAKNPSHIALLCFALSFIPSIAALSLLLWPVSRIAALLFPAVCLFWCFIVVRLRLGRNMKPPAK